MKLTAATQKALEESKFQHYVVVTRSDSKLREAFFAWCKEVGEPFVCVERRSRYSSVLVDMITVNDDRPFMRNIPWYLVTEMREFVHNYSEVSAMVCFSPDAVSSSKVLNERAEVLAGLLYAAATAPRKLSEIEIEQVPLDSHTVN